MIICRLYTHKRWPLLIYSFLIAICYEILRKCSENRVHLFDWPPQTPDLSPIKNLLNILKIKVVHSPMNPK